MLYDRLGHELKKRLLGREDVAPLSGLVHLTSLDLHGTRVIDVAPLSGLVNLTTLDLAGTRVSDVAPLPGLVDLSTLYFGLHSGPRRRSTLRDGSRG